MTIITVEVLPDSGPPQVGVTVTGLEAGAQVISVQVSWDAGDSWRAVAGGDHVSAVGGAFVRDHFPPLNVASSWRVIEHSVSGEPATESATLTVPSSVSWLQDPLNPRDAVSLVGRWPTGDESMMLWGTAADAAYEQEVEFAHVLGADRPVASVGQRMVAGQVPLQVAHAVAAEGGKLRRMLMSSGALILRLGQKTMLDPVAHIAVGTATEHVHNPASNGQISTWDLTATQVRPMSLRFVVPWWTYAQVAALWPGMTYADIDAARPGDSYLDWSRDPQP